MPYGKNFHILASEYTKAVRAQLVLLMVGRTTTVANAENTMKMQIVKLSFLTLKIGRLAQVKLRRITNRMLTMVTAQQQLLAPYAEL